MFFKTKKHIYSVGRGDERYSEHKVEIEISRWLINTFGGDVQLLSEINKNRIKTPDIQWRNKFREIKRND